MLLRSVLYLEICLGHRAADRTEALCLCKITRRVRTSHMVDEGVLVTGRVAESRRHNQFYTVDIISEIHDDLLTLIGLRLE